MEILQLAILLGILGIGVYAILVGTGKAGRQSYPDYETWYLQNGATVKWGGIFVVLSASVLIIISFLE
ncbi:MAG: hypothetical protein HOH43_06950 [Candidatus Latescibacteria bacterium]|jgi:hypothetical protein|nr:hypothetical protein [Candidatus Latescibacterota bacterium]